MKIQHVYTVTRTFEIPDNKLKEEINNFGGVLDERGEWLYGGTCDKETIDVYMRVFKKGKNKSNMKDKQGNKGIWEVVAYNNIYEGLPEKSS